MHFRIRGNNVQLIKSVLNEDAGRTKPTLVGSANLLTGHLNEKAEAALSDEEKALVAKWLERRQILNRKKAEVEILSLAETMTAAAKLLPDMDEDLGREVVAEVLLAAQDFRRVARKHQLM
ncbi:hypothetical protein CCR95_04585 [Thiocystis minor]|uniref:hypothetical protein n=1 Tax=Thiocystis minor TaxID=61597 RepID=UPI0019124163|nr:hypothetical protein [Thiocystis minor]MBK5963385.1 hypothetical protein [Thiocystis minor]